MTIKEKKAMRYKIWASKNKARLSERRKRYWIENKAKEQQNAKQYQLSHKYELLKKRRIYIKNRCKIDHKFKAAVTIRTLICQSISKMGYRKTSKTEQVLGCDFNTFKSYMENKFTKGMSWDNHGEWHIDHKIPLASAKTEEEAIKLNHYSNLQPLWATSKIAEKYGEVGYIGNLEKRDN
jgi:hypothetical protein